MGTVRADRSDKSSTAEAPRVPSPAPSGAAAFIFHGRAMRYVNPAAVAMTGYSAEELLAMDFWVVIHPDHRELVRQRGLARQRGEAVPLSYEVKILPKHGEPLHWASSAPARSSTKAVQRCSASRSTLPSAMPPRRRWSRARIACAR
jgi:PAS domain S-box-containing protein